MDTPSTATPEKGADHQAQDFTTTDSPLRYLAYLRRVKTALIAGTRYLAYTSDVGEAFRPVVPRRIVQTAYGISWAYVIGDVAYEGYKEHHHGSDSTQVTRTVVKRALFQTIASMALPAFAIHTQVRIFSKVFGRLGRFQRWGPTAAGLALIPALPFIFDHPVEHALDWVFEKYWPSDKRHGSSHSEPHHRPGAALAKEIDSVSTVDGTPTKPKTD